MLLVWIKLTIMSYFFKILTTNCSTKQPKYLTNFGLMWKLALFGISEKIGQLFIPTSGHTIHDSFCQDGDSNLGLHDGWYRSINLNSSVIKFGKFSPLFKIFKGLIYHLPKLLTNFGKKHILLGKFSAL